MNTKYKELGYHRSFACVDLTAIKSNFDALKARLAPEVKTMAVVKADAYGHGAVRVAQTLKEKADYFAVAVIEEALVLRENGIENPILILSYTSPYQHEALIKNNLISTVYTLEDARLLSAVAERLGKKAVIHVAVDTGMSRIGFGDTQESAEIIKSICGLPYIEVEGIFTHFACADIKDKSAVMIQKKRFDAFVSLLESKGVYIPIKHACNSAAIIDFDNHYDMVRMGISLYGLLPSDEVISDGLGLAPAMEVISHVIHVKDVEAGVGIGYGHTYVTDKKRRIATVCIGYADGFNRSLSNSGYVLIKGKKAPITGRVCMDMVMVDVSDIDDVKVGESVVVMGRSGDEEITAENLGAMCNSFNYEIICTFMPRVPRIYYDNGEVIQ